ncbi:hypothetical protein [Chitinophaga sp.]
MKWRQLDWAWDDDPVSVLGVGEERGRLIRLKPEQVVAIRST